MSQTVLDWSNSLKLKTLLLLLPLFVFTSCYYSAHSYNHGKLLDPGNSMFTFGVGGTRQSVIEEEAYNSYASSESVSGIDTTQDSNWISATWRSIALNYQLGVHEKYPFGGGIEIGILFEGQYYRPNTGNSVKSDILPSIDFNTRLGFKDIVTDRSIFQHNLELGWTTGMWLDNGFFIGYAAGWEFEWMIPYLGIRGVVMPTNIQKNDYFPGDDEFWEYSDRKFNLRLAMGVSLKFSKRRFIPDYITPEFTLTGPNASPNEPVNGHIHLGFRWTNGL